MPINEKEFLDTRELAVYLGMSKKFVEKHCQTGRLPGASKIGGRWRFRRTEIEKRLLAGRLLLDN